MGTVRSVEVCLAPSIELSSGEASTMGGIAEQAILRDYLYECSRTPPNPFQSPRATREEWWDTGNRDNYKAILLERHSEINEQRLRAIKKLKVPDISTWQGKYQRNKIIDPSQPSDRNELYEIKPDSAWGILAGLTKTKGMEDNFRELGLRGYKFGSWYPSPPGSNVTARKPVEFRDIPDFIKQSFVYRLERLARSMRALGATLRITSVALEVERRYSGLLYYKICVKMELDFNGEEKVARRVVRRLYEALTASAKQERKLQELKVAESYRVMDKDGKPLPEPQPDPRVVRALDAEEQFLVEKITLVPELDNAVSALGQALFTRLRGLPGEQFLVCCDETYLENEIKLPQKIRLSKLLKNLQIRPPIPVQGTLALAGGINKPMSYMLAALYVIAKAADSPSELFQSPENFRAAQRWLEANPAISLIVGGVVVYGTALVVAGTVATGGALFAAPAVGSAAGAGAPAGAGLQSQLGSGLVRSLAGETIKDAALPMIEEALPMGEKAVQQAIQQSATSFSEEAARRVAERELQVMIQRQLAQTAQTEIEKAAARALAKEVAAERMKKALVAGGTTLGAVALRIAFSGAPVNTPNAAPMGTMSTIAAEAGLLHLLKLNNNVDLNRLPQLYAEAKYSGFTGEIPGGFVFQPDPGTEKPKYFHLGVIRCL